MEPKLKRCPLCGSSRICLSAALETQGTQYELTHKAQCLRCNASVIITNKAAVKVTKNLDDVIEPAVADVWNRWAEEAEKEEAEMEAKYYKNSKSPFPKPKTPPREGMM